MTKGSSKDYSQPILLFLFATKERDPSTTLRMTEMPCFKALTMANQFPNCSPSPSPDCVGSSLPEGALKKGKPSPVILSERMRVEALRSAGGAKPRNEVTKGSSKNYSQPILLLLFATKERDPSTSLRMTGRVHSYNNSLCHKAKLHFDRNFTLP